MSGVLFPKVHVPMSSLVDIIKQEQKRREDCRKRLEEKAEFMLKKRLEKIIRVHKFEKAVRKSAKQGKNTVEIPLKKGYRFSCDMSSPYIELRDKKFDIHVSISHNQFLEALEQSLYEEKQIDGNIKKIVNDMYGSGKLTEIIKSSWSLSENKRILRITDSNHNLPIPTWISLHYVSHKCICNHASKSIISAPFFS